MTSCSLVAWYLSSSRGKLNDFTANHAANKPTIAIATFSPCRSTSPLIPLSPFRLPAIANSSHALDVPPLQFVVAADCSAGGDEISSFGLLKI
jgi:hypothetical protein